MDAALNSNTPVTHYMDMPLWRFYDLWEAVCAVQQQKAEAIAEMRKRR